MCNRDNGSSISFSCFIKTGAKGFFIEYTSQGKFVQLKKRNRKPIETRSISKETLLRGLKEPSGGNSGNISECLEFIPFKIEPGCRSFVHCLLLSDERLSGSFLQNRHIIFWDRYLKTLDYKTLQPPLLIPSPSSR